VKTVVEPPVRRLMIPGERESRFPNCPVDVKDQPSERNRIAISAAVRHSPSTIIFAILNLTR